MTGSMPRAALLTLTLAVAPAAWSAESGKAPEQLGKVSFANSCVPAVQERFERGVALLHSFWFTEGAVAFREVLEADPNCAIATWGLASILIGNPFAAGPTPQRAAEAQAAIERGRKIAGGTERERAYVEAIAAYYDHFSDRPPGARRKSLSDAFEALAKRFPDDETQIFSGLYLTSTQAPTDKSFATTLRAAAILEPQFAKHPDHPGVAHYLIHSYDYPAVADQGLAAALCYADIAPSAPHALHMPSHIFTRVGAWRESVATNQRSVATGKAAAIPEPIESIHAMDYMVYADLQLARDRDAAGIVEEAQRITAPGLAQALPYARAAIPARYAVERGMWRDAAQLRPATSKFVFTDAMTYFARALGAARAGDPAAAEKDVQELAGIVATLKAENDDYWATEVEVERLAAAAWVAFAEGRHDEALALARSAADLEDSSEKSAVTPGRLIPARELLGDMLLASGRAGEALAAYESSQTRDPKRFRGLYGAAEAAAAAGARDKALYYFGRLDEMAGSGDPRPELAKARAYLAAR
jgi:tetratricopeptide (TPR) repeat protein